MDSLSNDASMTEGDRRQAWQVERQLQDSRAQARRLPDLTPFREALDAYSAEDLASDDARLAGATVLDLQAMMDAGDLTSERLVTHFLARIERHDVGKLNSVLALAPDALEVARTLDAARAGTEGRNAVYGIPVLLKDNVATAGPMPTTAGSALLADAVADRDSHIAKKLREAGAVILGKTNMSEFAYFFSSESPSGFSGLGGQTHNAHGPFDCGGSSSGSGVAASARLAPLTIGSETAGSIVQPSSQNSIFGLRPSSVVFSRDRVIPISSLLDTAGPMCGKATDLAALFAAVASVDPEDAPSTDAAGLESLDILGGLDAGALKGLKVAVVRLEQVHPDDARTGDAELMDDVERRLKEQGAVLTTVELDTKTGTTRLNEVMAANYRDEVTAYLRATNGPFPSTKELVQAYADQGEAVAPWGFDQIDGAVKDALPAEEAKAVFDAEQAKARAAIEAALAEADADVILTLRSTLSPQYSFAGYPAVSIPAGAMPSGEPFGLTFTGRHLDDVRLLSLAYAWEQAYPEAQQIPQL